MPQVTVILTSYNHAKYLREAIESVLHQTFSDFELIIGDDASTDESWDIIQSYSDPRIRAYRHETHRMGGIINETVLSGNATGELIAIQHSDDVWEPHKLKAQVDFLEQNSQVGAVFSNVLLIGESGEILSHRPDFDFFHQPQRNRHEWLHYFFYTGNALCHPSVLIRKECYDKCGLYRFGLIQLGDFDMWVRLCLKYEVHVLPDKLLRLRLRENHQNASGNSPEARVRRTFEYYEILKNYKSLTDSDDLIKVFPKARQYIKPEGFDPGFILGMAALEPETYLFTRLFGLELLFEAVSNPERARRIETLYGFTYMDFISLTTQHDVFSFELVAQLQSQVPALNDRVNALEVQANTLATQVLQQGSRIQGLTQYIDDLHNSRSWKLISALQRIRARLLRRA